MLVKLVLTLYSCSQPFKT